MWDRIDPLAEKYYGISPYAYCGGDPVNYEEYDNIGLLVALWHGNISSIWALLGLHLLNESNI